MKKILTIATFALLALGAGYAVGYHRGLQNEQRAWESTVQEDRDNEQRICGLSYRNPHKFFTVSSEGVTVNVPSVLELPVK
jgi:hypothetical protein